MAPDNRDIYPEGPQIKKVILQNIVDSLQVSWRPLKTGY